MGLQKYRHSRPSSTEGTPPARFTLGNQRLMLPIRVPQEMAGWSAAHRRDGRTIAFVPTMGALHEGHLELVRTARAACDKVVVSIFVNPLQFNNKQDLENYPRQPEADARALEQVGCDALFLPDNEGIYAGHAIRHYALGALDEVLEGPSRPGHFQGVINVVERLFHYVRPDRAFFGEKDRQQLAVVRHVASQQRWPERITGVPTLRAPDGLALSSRNARLNARERAQAPVLFKALSAMQAQAFRSSVAAAREAGLAVLHAEPAIRLDYLEIAEPEGLQPITSWGDRTEAVALIAAFLGPVRLIDNITLRR